MPEDLAIIVVLGSRKASRKFIAAASNIVDRRLNLMEGYPSYLLPTGLIGPPNLSEIEANVKHEIEQMGGTTNAIVGILFMYSSQLDNRSPFPFTRGTSFLGFSGPILFEKFFVVPSSPSQDLEGRWSDLVNQGMHILPLESQPELVLREILDDSSWLFTKSLAPDTLPVQKAKMGIQTDLEAETTVGPSTTSTSTPPEDAPPASQIERLFSPPPDSHFSRADLGLDNAKNLILQVANTRLKTQIRAHVEKILVGLQQVMSVLGGAAEYDPRAKTAVTLFMGVLQLEIDRRNNDEAIATVCYYMASMMNAIRPLNSTLGSVLLGTEAEDLRNRLSPFWEGIARTVTEFGSFAELYYTKCRPWLVRFCRGTEFKSKIQNFVDTFVKHRQDIEAVLSVHVAIAQGRMSADIVEMKRSLSVIVDRLDIPSSEAERNAMKSLKARGSGGVELPLSSIDVEVLAKALNDSITSNMIDAAKKPLKDLLGEQDTRFQFILRSAEERTTDNITRSTQKILTEINEGPHDLIDDLDVKTIWKGSGWKFSINYRTFIDGLCTYYITKFSQLRRGEQPKARIDDDWTIVILQNAAYYQAIAEAIDDDANDFISVYEINNFLKMNRWLTTPAWFAFWAAGPRYLDYTYAMRISDTISELKEACHALRVSNRDFSLDKCIHDYLETFELVQIITDPIDGDGLGDLDPHTAGGLREAAEKVSGYKKDLIEENLKQLGYQVEASSLNILTGQVSFRIEQDITVLLFLILQKHREILVKGTLVDSEAGICASRVQEMQITVIALIRGFNQRFKALQMSWRAQKLDIPIQVQSYSGGLFSRWYDWYRQPNNKKFRLLEDSGSKQYISAEFEDILYDSREPDSPLTANLKIEQVYERLEIMESRLEAMESRLDSRLETIESMLKGLLSLSDHKPAAALGIPQVVGSIAQGERQQVEDIDPGNFRRERRGPQPQGQQSGYRAPLSPDIKRYDEKDIHRLQAMAWSGSGRILEKTTQAP
ncbi:hypothetical protein B0H14DRAFT_2855560 [Mycena olivaceomarginata]|nr:hypothetical protein B0H14DRAFT_2855560 [Mycena olivaceomarginata]